MPVAFACRRPGPVLPTSINQSVGEFLECLLDLVQQAVRRRFSIWISCRCREGQELLPSATRHSFEAAERVHQVWRRTASDRSSVYCLLVVRVLG